MPRWTDSLALLSLLALGCAGNSTVALSPELAATTETREAPGLLMAAEVTLDFTADGIQASLEPIAHRSGAAEEPALGTRALVDLGTYLKGQFCQDCLQLVGVARPDAEHVDVVFSVAHPFQTEAGRLDLHLFDVRGHLAGDRPTVHAPEIGIPVPPETPQEARAEIALANADGYSSFFDAVAAPALGLPATTPNLRGYMYFWKDLSQGNVSAASASGFTDLQNPTGHNVFPAGGTHDDPRARATFRLDFSAGLPQQVKFVLAVDASYGKTALNGAPESAKYFLPFFNQPAPVVVETEIISNDLQSGDAPSTAMLEVRVGDWQAGIDPLDNPEDFDFATSPLNSLRIPGEPMVLNLMIPGILAAPIERYRTSNDGGLGTPTDPYQFRIPITNALAAPAGTYYGLVQVNDYLLTSPAEHPLVVARDGRTVVPYGDIATYQLFPITVAETINLSPVADILPDRTVIVTEESVNFCPGPGTMDPDGEIVMWEYDFDYDSSDPESFEADLTYTTGAPDLCGDHVYSNFGFPDQFVYTAGMRVTDNGTPPRSAIDTVRITVNPE